MNAFFYPLAIPKVSVYTKEKKHYLCLESSELQTDPLSIRENDTTHKRNLWYSVAKAAGVVL